MSPKASVITLLLALVLSLATAQTARSQTYTWNLDANGSWNTAGNWNPAVVPNAQGVTAVLGNIITADRTVTLSSSVSLGTLSFAGATHSYMVSGNSSTFLNLDNGGSPALITMPASVAAHQYIDAPLAAVSDLIVTNDTSSSNLLIRGGINLGSRTMTFNGSGTVTIGSTFGITGSNGLVVLDGPGQVLLEANNTGVKYVVNAGTLVVESNNAMSPSSFVADLVTINNNATLRFDYPLGSDENVGIVLGSGGGQLSTAAAIPIIHAGVISGSGSLTKSGAGTIALAGVNTYTGDTLVRQGTLRFDGNVLNGAASILGNSTSAVIVGDDAGSNSTALLAGTSSALTFARDITVVGNASQGTSTVTIGSATGSGGVAYTGTVTLNRSVVLSNAGASGSQISFGKITGTGGVTIGGGGLTVFTSTASDFTGTVTIGTAGVGTGILSIGSDALLGASGNAIVLNGGTLQVTGSSPWSTARSITLGASGVFTTSVIDVENTDAVSGFTITSPITGGGTLRKIGPGILTFSGANTYSSGTLVEAGTLRVTAANVLSPNSSLSVSNGATVKLNGFSQTVTGLTNPSGTTGGTIDLGSSAGTILTINQTTFSTPYPNFTGAITGTGDVVKTGLSTQQLGGTSSYLGTTTVRQGILELTNFVPSSGNGPLGNSAGGAIRLGDANFSDLDAVLFNADKSINGFGRPITVVAGSGTRTIGHQLNTNASDGSTVTFSGPITLEKDLQIFTKNDIGHGARFQITGVVSGTGGLVKLGAGQATLAADNTYTGTTTVLNGQLVIGGQSLPDAAARSSSGFRVQADYRDFVGASFNPIPFLAGIVTPELAIYDFSPNPDRIGNVDVTLAEGKFTYWGQSAGASTESFQNLVLERGKNRLDVITANNASTTSATLSMTGGFVRNPGDGTLVVVSANTLGKPDGGDYTRVLAATAPTLLGGGGADGSTNISIIPWAYHDTDPNGSAPTTVETFLTYGATGLRPLLDSEYVTSLTAPGTLNNVRIIATSSTLAVDQTINSLRYGLDAGGTITLTGHKLTINSGAILATNGSSGALTFNGGEIAFGTAEGIIQTTLGGNVVINSVISGSGGLTFSGSLGGGSLALNGANTYTGPTTILAGGVQFNSAASFGSGGDPIRFRNSSAGGSMTYTGAGTTTLTNPIELGIRSTGINANNSGTLVLNGVISGNALTTTFSGTGLGFSGNGTIELRAANTFTGSVGLSGGTLGIVDNNNFGNAANQLSLGATSNPTLRFDAANIDLARSTVVGGHLTFDTNGFNATISGAFAGGSDAYIITKSGAGTLSLTGASTTRAKLQVSGGTVNVNGTWGTFLTTVATVNSGGSLGGNGTLNSFVTVNDGGTLAPGAGTGTLTMHSLAFAANANATYEWEAGASTQDSITITNGPLNLSRIHTTLKLYDRGLGFNVTPDQKFALFTVAGLNSITGFDPANFSVVFADASAWAAGQYTLTLDSVNGNSVLYLSGLTPAPEPGGILAVAGAGLLVVAGRRRLRRARHQLAS